LQSNPLPEDVRPRMKQLWNLGVKVGDLDAELSFFERCGATQIQKGTIPTAKGEEAFGMAFLGEQRLLLFPRVIYQDALAEPMKGGLAHAVFEVQDVEDGIERYRKRGVSPMWGPETLSTPFGRRRIVFFRSPSGFIFETFETLS
jgi:catechol 2,3-dioxygenase-like lactoylglutathione lyase family enzyme